MLFRFAQLKNAKGELVWVQVSRSGGLNPAAQKLYGQKKAAKWVEVEAASWSSAKAAAVAKKGKTVTASAKTDALAKPPTKSIASVAQPKPKSAATGPKPAPKPTPGPKPAPRPSSAPPSPAPPTGVPAGVGG